MDEALHCVNHPKVETRLRCNKCGQPICSKCAVRTPVGYRCRVCVNAQQRVFYAGFRPGDYLIAAVVALPLSLVAGWLTPQLGWYAIFLGPIVGGGIAEAARWATRRRRGQYTWLVVCGCVVFGALPALILSLLSLVGLLAGTPGLLAYSLGGIMRLVWAGVYLLTATGAAYARLRTGRRI
ncbi:MAG: hypothetical protein PVI07_02530 [Anaerolineae bacterium]|jgi:hypothetical protein